MEADAGADLINNSNILKEAGQRARVVVGDEDSSTIAAARKGTRFSEKFRKRTL